MLAIELHTQEAWFLVEMGDRPRWEHGAVATAHLGFLKARRSWGESLAMSTGDGRCMVCPVLDTKALPRELLTIVHL